MTTSVSLTPHPRIRNFDVAKYTQYLTQLGVLAREPIINEQSLVLFQCLCGRTASRTRTSIIRLIRRKVKLKCSCPERPPLEEISSLAERDGAILLSRQYKNNTTPLEFRCRCGRLFKNSKIQLRQFTGCPECRAGRKARNIGDRLRLSFEEVKKRFKAEGLVLLSEPAEYKGNESSLKYRCPCGESHQTCLVHVSQTRKLFQIRCPKCRPSLTGALNPNWDPEISEEERALRKGRSNEVHRWYRAIIRRAGFRCELSGRGGTLSAHHLNNYANHPEQRISMENGVCLLRELHLLFHSTYGRRKCTEGQFKEFCLRFHEGEFDGEISFKRSL